MSVTAEPTQPPQAGDKLAYRLLEAGDPAPTFKQKTRINPEFVFDSVAGRYIVLGFFGSAGSDVGKAALDILRTDRDLFDDDKIAFFGVSMDPADEPRLPDSLPGVRYFWDFDQKVSKLYGAAPVQGGSGGGQIKIQPRWVVIDPTLRVISVIPFQKDGRDREQLIATLKALPTVRLYAGLEVQAPVLYLPRVFEPELCRTLIDLYEKHGGETSGFMSQQGEMTVLKHDPAHKRRRDHMLIDQKIIETTRSRVRRRIMPEIMKAHQFEVTRMERYLVACYSEEDQGHFRAHRDNTTKGTAHRRFAVSINLNDEFEGGEICFPEYGPRSFKPPPGGAVVFSCSLLHAVTPVTKGRRYAFLPFLYDEAAAKIREENNVFLDPNLGSGYVAGN